MQNLNSTYPVLMMDKALIPAARDFYVRYFGFEVTFNSDWYVSLEMPGHANAYELALVDYTHETVPAPFRKPVQGLIINFEISDVDDAYQRIAIDGGLALVQELRSEEFGQRHFMVADPAGVVIDVITLIPYGDSFAETYGMDD